MSNLAALSTQNTPIFTPFAYRNVVSFVEVGFFSTDMLTIHA